MELRQNQPPRYKPITAAEYWHIYRANEIAADDRFLGKAVLISGTLVSIRKDAFGYVRAELASEASPFMNVQARLSADAVAKAAHLTPGQIIQLQCVGATMVVGIPSLRECRFREDVLAGVRAQLALQIVDWFDGKGVPSFAADKEARTSLFILYLIGTKGGLSSKCLKELVPKVCAADFKAFEKKIGTYRDEFRATYIAATPSLHLPPAIPGYLMNPPEMAGRSGG